MKFLTDENIASHVVLKLRQANYDVKDVKEEALRGLSDKKLLELSYKEERVLLSHDKDFIHLPARVKHNGIIIIRLQWQTPESVSQRLLHLLRSSLRRKLANRVTLLTDTRVVLR